MEIDAEKSEVGPDSEGIPVSISASGNVVRSPRINITTAQTTVSAASGQTIVIGGLITDNKSSTSRRVPWLSDVPLLGNLFRYDSNTNVRKELLIILTPHVVRGRSEAEYIKQVEMARMSWISCDIFDWMNTDSSVAGQLDSNSIPTIYPDQTPGSEAFEQIEMHDGVNPDSGIQQMSFSSSNSTESKPAKPSKSAKSTDAASAKKPMKVIAAPDRDPDSDEASEPDNKPRSNSNLKSKPKPKSIWSLR